MFQCCNPAENAIFCAIQVYLPCVYGNRKSQPGNTLLQHLSHLWTIRQMPLRVRFNFTFQSTTKRPINAPHLLYFAQYCYIFKLYFRKSYQKCYNTTLYTSKQRFFLLYFLQYCYNISIYYTILRQE